MGKVMMTGFIELGPKGRIYYKDLNRMAGIV